jgi:hypothetical protein
MKILKWLLIISVFFVILPGVLTVVLFKYTATPLFNAVLQSKVNSPARIQKVETNWLLTKFVIENFVIENPRGFPKGDMLRIPYVETDIAPKTYIVLKPYLTLTGKNIYFHFIRKSDNSTNIAVAFGLPVQKAQVEPLEFEIKNFSTTVSVQTLKKIIYEGKGKFIGFHNNADFSFNGTADASDKSNIKSITDFVVYNWRIRNNKYLNQLARLLNNPSLREITLTKIDGRIKTEGAWVIFADRNTKAYTVGNVLFAEIYKGSKYNRKTKELNIYVALYLPMRIKVHITGTAEKPKIEIENLKSLITNGKFLPQGNVLNKVLEKPANNIPVDPQKVLEKPIKQIENATKKVKETVEKSVKELQEELNKAFQGLIGN